MGSLSPSLLYSSIIINIFLILFIMTTILPLGNCVITIRVGLLDKAISSRVWILMKDDREFEGTLRGFDDFFSIELMID